MRLEAVVHHIAVEQPPSLIHNFRLDFMSCFQGRNVGLKKTQMAPVVKKNPCVYIDRCIGGTKRSQKKKGTWKKTPTDIVRRIAMRKYYVIYTSWDVLLNEIFVLQK
jgi:hypothetical protein